MSKRKDFTGMRFGKLVVVSLVGYFPKGCIWNTICDCGNEVTKYGTQLTKSKHVRSCGCTRAENVKKSRWTGHCEISGSYLKRLEHNAKLRGIEYNLSPEYIWGIFLTQNRICALSGMEIKFSSKANEASASLDRIDPGKGYDEGNVQWVHKTINEMKWDLSALEFNHFCSLISAPITESVPSSFCEETKHHKNWGGYGNIPRDLFTRYAKNAAKRGIPFRLTIEDFWELFLEQKGKCYFTGLSLSVGGVECDTTASLDRIDNSLGYTVGNVKWVHKTVNTKIRKNMRVEDLLYFCRKVREFNYGENT